MNERSPVGTIGYIWTQLLRWVGMSSVWLHMHGSRASRKGWGNRFGTVHLRFWETGTRALLGIWAIWGNFRVHTGPGISSEASSFVPTQAATSDVYLLLLLGIGVSREQQQQQRNRLHLRSHLFPFSVPSRGTSVLPPPTTRTAPVFPPSTPTLLPHPGPSSPPRRHAPTFRGNKHDMGLHRLARLCTEYQVISTHACPTLPPKTPPLETPAHQPTSPPLRLPTSLPSTGGGDGDGDEDELRFDAMRSRKGVGSEDWGTGGWNLRWISSSPSSGRPVMQKFLSSCGLYSTRLYFSPDLF